jgi:hypothetical protein
MNGSAARESVTYVSGTVCYLCVGSLTGICFHKAILYHEPHST